MKYVFGLFALLELASLARANVADTVCQVKGTPIRFDLGSSTPPDEGSRLFAGIDIYSRPDPEATPLYSINDTSKYDVQYADGVLADGAAYFRVSLNDRKTGKNFYAFARQGSKSRKAYSTIVSSLPGAEIPAAKRATFKCDGFN